MVEVLYIKWMVTPTMQRLSHGWYGVRLTVAHNNEAMYTVHDGRFNYKR